LAIRTAVTLGTPTSPSHTTRQVLVFMLGTDGAIYSIWQTMPGAQWTNWMPLGHP
jgi:hypothetical protein